MKGELLAAALRYRNLESLFMFYVRGFAIALQGMLQ
jgi:hypothetical protein